MNGFLLPRGIRNNNPGNIRLSQNRWRGQKDMQADTDFIEFVDAEYGLRALMRLLMTYFFKYRLTSIESIMNRYAPPVENDTDRYAGHVAQRLGVTRRAQIDLSDRKTLVALCRAIVRHENGRAPAYMPDDWYLEDVYVRAADMAFAAG